MKSTKLQVQYIKPLFFGDVKESKAKVIRIWDNSLLIETNVPALAGNDRLIQWDEDNGDIFIEGQPLYFDITTKERETLNSSI